MTSSVISVKPDQDLAEAFKIMKTHDIRHLPVIDKKQNLVGILSNRDLVEFSTTSLVKDFMSHPVMTAAIDTPLGEVTQRMIDKKVSAIVVVRDGHVAGILTTHDLLKTLKVFLRSHSQPPPVAFNPRHDMPLSEVMAGLSQMGY